VAGVVLVGFDIGPDEPRIDQPNPMPEPLDLTRPVMSARAGFHRHHAARQPGDEGQQLPASELFSQYRPSARITAVELEHVLCQIDPDSSNFHSWTLLVLWSMVESTIVAH